MNDYLHPITGLNQSIKQSIKQSTNQSNLPLIRDEIFLSYQPNCTFSYGEVESTNRVNVSLTSHRLIINQSRFIHLSLVQSFAFKSALFRSPTIKLVVNPYPVNQSINHSVNQSSVQSINEEDSLVQYERLLINPLTQRNQPISPGYFKLVFHSNCDADAFRSKLQIALDSKAWMRSFAVLENEAKQLAIQMSINQSTNQSGNQPINVPAPRAFSTTSAGVSGLIRSAQSESQNVDSTMKAAFSDLDALMKSASDLIALADKFSKSRSINQSTSQSAEEREVESLMQSFGLSHIVNPVERSNTNSNQSYYNELAHEILKLLQPRFNQSANQSINHSSTEMLALTDVYCLYNRARGVSLISPNDCLKACQQLGRISSLTSKDPIILYEFPESRARVVCRASLVDSVSVNEKIIQSINQSVNQSLSVLEASSRLQLSSLLIEQRITQLERDGQLVRDESIEGCKYMINRFPEFVLTIVNR